MEGIRSSKLAWQATRLARQTARPVPVGAVGKLDQQAGFASARVLRIPQDAGKPALALKKKV